MQYSINVAGVLLSISDVLRAMPIAPLLTRISGQFSCSSEWVRCLYPSYKGASVTKQFISSCIETENCFALLVMTKFFEFAELPQD